MRRSRAQSDVTVPITGGGAQPRINETELVTLTVTGQIAHPTSNKSPYRIDPEGTPRVLPGTGGIVLSHRIGDLCVGLAADHVEPGVSIRNERTTAKGDKEGANLALNTYACIGNDAIVINGPCKGARGIVTGKHGGVNNALIDYPESVLRALRNGDQVQVYARGTGLRFPDFPHVIALNCSPRLLRRWRVRSDKRRLRIPVTHIIPAAIMGSGLGRNNAVRGDYDIQMFDETIVRRFALDRLRFGDLVAIAGADTRYGRSFNSNFITMGVVIHSDSTASGHGPGVTSLLSGHSSVLVPSPEPRANLAAIFGVRPLAKAAARGTLVQKEKLAFERHEKRVARLAGSR